MRMVCVIVGDPQKKENEREKGCALFGRSVAWVLINNVPSEVLCVALKNECFGSVGEAALKVYLAKLQDTVGQATLFKI